VFGPHHEADGETVDDARGLSEAQLLERDLVRPGRRTRRRAREVPRVAVVGSLAVARRTS
jgi:hypothetical protein